MKYLMIFSIGPVQDFIATARRSRDLWYGSWMLSELSRAAAITVEQYLIFPANPNSILNVPNKIVAIVEGEPNSIANNVETEVYARMKELGENALNRVKTTTIDRSLAEEQIQNLPEFYWVSVPLDENKYSETRDQAEALLAARKSTRDFKQVVGKNAPKSSLDGARESVISEGEYPRKDYKDKIEKIKALYDNYHARQGERLSGVDILKRLGETKHEPDFRSTSHMAALPFIEKIGSSKSQKLIGEIRNLFDDAGWNIGERDDGALLYESRLSDWIPRGEEQDQLRNKFITIFEKVVGKSRPSPYYALLAADGDNMGVVIDAQKTPQAHHDLSEALSKFASKAPAIVKEKQGVLIYSGGDDVLAYLPLHKVLECAEELEQEYKGLLGKFDAIKDGETISPTLSTGIVIAHHLEPLSDVLELAREAEKIAKRVDNIHKNGFAITLSKRGGADRTISGKCGVFDMRLKQLIAFVDSDAISAGTAYELQVLHRVMSNTGIPPEGLAKEAMRIVEHKQQSGGESVISKAVKAIFNQWITKDKIPLNELAKEMIVARMLASDSQLIEENLEVES